MHLVDLIKIRLSFDVRHWLSCIGWNSSHQPCEPWNASQETFVVVAPMIGSRPIEPLETPSTQLSNERMVPFQSEVLVYVGNEEFFVDDFPASSMWLKRWRDKLVGNNYEWILTTIAMNYCSIRAAVILPSKQ